MAAQPTRAANHLLMHGGSLSVTRSRYWGSFRATNMAPGWIKVTCRVVLFKFKFHRKNYYSILRDTGKQMTTLKFKQCTNLFPNPVQ